MTAPPSLPAPPSPAGASAAGPDDPPGRAGQRSPRIGITVDNLHNAAASGRYDVGTGYSRAVAAAGGLPLLLPHEPELVEHYVELCDGLILTGGVDPDTAALPEHWAGHGPTHAKARVMDPQRQAFELALLEARDEHKPDLPLLGICLGMQLLALHRGGTLDQYLPDHHPPEVVDRHRDAHHDLVIRDDESPVVMSDFQVASHHQQAVADPGQLRVAAVSRDDIIEAVFDPAHPFCLGVQWHPERTDDCDNPYGHRLIEKLVQAADPCFPSRS